MPNVIRMHSMISQARQIGRDINLTPLTIKIHCDMISGSECKKIIECELGQRTEKEKQGPGTDLGQ